MKHIILILTFITLSFSSCEKDPIDKCKDDPTCEYFRCKVDGKEWRPNCEGNGGLGCSAWDMQYYKDIPQLEFIVKKADEDENLRFYCFKKLVIGDNVLSTGTGYLDLDLFPCHIFPLDTSKSNNLYILKLDTISRIIEAKFNFSAQNDCGKRVVITDGEFRMQYTF